MNPLVNLALSVGETLVHEGGRLLFGIALGTAKELLGTPQPLGTRQLALNRALQKKAVDGALLAGPRTGEEYAKFTLKKGLPTDQQTRTLAVENEPHSVDDFNGVIKEGYGKGEKRLIYSGTGVIKVGGSSQLGRINVHEHQAEKSGFHYDFVAEGVEPHTRAFEVNIANGGRLAGITAKLTVRPEEATYFDRKEKRKKTSSIWALSLEVEGDDMRKLISNLTENARLFAETRKLLGSGGKVLEVVEDEQEQAPEVAAEFYPANGTSNAESVEANPVPVNPPPNSAPAPELSSHCGNCGSNGGNGSGKSHAKEAASQHAGNNGNNGNGSHRGSGLNQLRNEFLATARRVATRKNQAIGEVVEWASRGAFKYGDIGRMTEADIPKLLAATEFVTSSLPGAAR